MVDISEYVWGLTYTSTNITDDLKRISQVALPPTPLLQSNAVFKASAHYLIEITEGGPQAWLSG